MVLLNSCLTVNVIMNRDSLCNIHPAEQPARIKCNAGTWTIRMKWRLGSFPKPVWYDPGGVANILSLNSVKDTIKWNMVGGLAIISS